MKKTEESTWALAIFFVFTFLGLAYSWPLFLYLFEGIPYTYYPDPDYKVSKMFQGDHLQAYYHISLLKLAAAGEIDWFSNPLEFATVHSPDNTSNYFLPMSIVFFPFSFISVPMAYNLLIIISFGLTGLSMYLWARELTGSRAAGLAAGLVFNFVPVRVVELLGGHPAGHAIFLFPLTLFFFERAVSRRSLVYASFGGLSSYILAVQYGYFSYYLLMFLMVYIPWRLIAHLRRAKQDGKSWMEETGRLAVAGVPFALGLGATVWSMLRFKATQVGESAIAAGRELSEVALFSPKLSALWDLHLGWGVYLGLALLAAPFGLIYGVFSFSPKSERRDALFFTAVFVISYILAFGTTLNDTIPLYSLFYNYFPYFNFSRTPVKIMVITVSAISILTAFFVRWALSKPRMTPVVLISLALIAVDYHPLKNIGICLLDEENRIYNRAAKEAGGGENILNLPIWPGESSWSSIYIYYAMQSRIPTINGYSPLVSQAYIDNVFWPLFPLNGGDVTGENIKLLKDFNVGLIMFHEEAYPPKISAYPASFALRRLLNSPHLRLVDKEEPLWLFKINESPSKRATTSVTSPIGVFFQAERLARINGTTREDRDAMNGYTLAGLPKKGESGERILNAGPYKTFPSGAYKAAFRMKISDNSLDGPVAKIDVAGKLGRVILAEKSIKGLEFKAPGEYQDFFLEYTLEPGDAWQIEFRSYLTGDAQVFIDSVYILLADQSDPMFEYEAEDLFYTGRIVRDTDAESSKAVMSVPFRDPSDLMVYGPYRLFKRGGYVARFRLKSSAAPKDEPLAFIKIVSANSWETIAEREVYIDDLPAPGKYGEVPLSFSLPKNDVIEFKVIFNGVSTLYVDKITIKPRL